MGGRVDEVNFWQPQATRPMKAMAPGEPVFFRLKKPVHAIAGYGFFAHFRVVDLDTAWELFGWKNGDPDKLGFLRRIGDYRHADLLDPRTPRAPIGCTVLRDAVFWPDSRWIPWGADMGWAPNIVQGRTETDPRRAHLLFERIAADERDVPADLGLDFALLADDSRESALREVATREGQGAFRLRLLDAYDGQCAITGEHTEPVLDAAHAPTQRRKSPPHSSALKTIRLVTTDHSRFQRSSTDTWTVIGFP
jgi:putative restriction endonuclease